MAVAGTGILGALGAGARPAVAAAPAPVAEELTLDGLGIGSQTVFAAHGVAEVYFPPPVAQVATSGSFVRVFFAHSPEAAAGSTMLIAVNGQPLLSVPLTENTAEGGVLETRVPAGLLDGQRPNRLQVRFDLQVRAGAPPLATMYGRLDGQSTMHYELFSSPDSPPGLEAYPYSLLAVGAASPAIGLLLPAAPDGQEIAAALRVAADLGRRAASRRLRPQVVTSDQLDWLAAGGTGALLVGRLDRLPAAAPVLQGARWLRTPAGWTAPDGTALKPGDGLLLAAISPWDHRTPLLLVAGGTDAAVARAAAALAAGGGLPLAGPYAIVPDVGAGAGAGPPAPGRTVQLSLLSPRGLAALGPGRYRATASFVAPAADPGDTGVLDLTVPGLGGTGQASTSVEADIDGSRVAASALSLAGTGPRQVRASFPGRLLRPGRNALTLDFRIEQPAQGAQAGAPGAQDALTAAGDDVARATLDLPLRQPASADLRLLPYPFFESSARPPMVVLADAGTTILAAAAQAMVALGSRSSEPPPALGVSLVGGFDASSGPGNLIVVGVPASGSRLDTVAGGLPLRISGSGSVTLAGGRAPGELDTLSTRLGAIQVMSGGPGERQVLWLAGTGGDMLGSAAAALYDARLTGDVQVVDAAGRLTPILAQQEGTPGAWVAGPGTSLLLILVAAGLLLGVLALQLLRPWRSGG